MGKIYPNDNGVEIRLDTHVTLTGATTLEMHVFKPTALAEEDRPTCPGGCECDLIWSATQYNTTQEIQYSVKAGDLDEPGRWRIQSYVVLADGSAHHGEPFELMVSPFGT